MTSLLLASAVLAQDASLAEAEKKMEARDFAGALADFDKLIQATPGDVPAQIGRARALSELDRVDDAIQSLGRAIEVAPKPDARLPYMRGLMYLRKEDTNAAIADFTKAIEIDPSDVRWYRWRGDALSTRYDFAAALADYDKALEIDPRDATALERRGQAKQGLRDFKGALEDFTRLVEVAPRHPRPFQLRGDAKLELGDYKGAIDDYDAVVYNDPSYGHAYVNRARAHLALGDKEAAEADVAQAVEQKPVQPTTYEERGRYYYDTGRPKEAVADFVLAVKADPKGQDYTRLFLFLARAKLGERTEAAAELKAYADGREKKDDWYGKVTAFLSGQMKEDAFLAAAKDGNEIRAREQECEACWYAGAVRLLDGDTAGAKALLDRCVATDVRNFIEYGSAKAALAGMK